jgi:uncharacterized protein YndB with AHSA1/START domain
MSQSEDLTIERTADLDIGVEQLWELISTPQGWSTWLVDDADVTIAPDESGTATDDGVQRDVHVDSITDGRGVSFSWWDRTDPSSASYVRLDVVELPDGRSQLRVTERFLGATASATMSCSAGVELGIAWEVRFASLWLLALHSTVLA